MNRSNQTFWQPITGGIEEGETHTEACIREVKEETGIKLCEAAIEELDFTLDVPIPEDKWIVRKSLFVVESTQEDVVLSSEHEGFRWVPFRDVLSYLIFDSNKQTFAQILRWIENQIPNR